MWKYLISTNLDEKEKEKASLFIKEKEVKYVGAIGGQFTFTFTPTSIGTIKTIIDNVSGEKCDLTDYDDF